MLLTSNFNLIGVLPIVLDFKSALSKDEKKKHCMFIAILTLKRICVMKFDFTSMTLKFFS